MSSEPESTSLALNGPWPVLDMQERRVLGVMVEKAKTTPDAYPMSVNALVTGSNQKSNREPILNLSDLDVELVIAPSSDYSPRSKKLKKTIWKRKPRWRSARAKSSPFTPSSKKNCSTPLRLKRCRQAMWSTWRKRTSSTFS